MILESAWSAVHPLCMIFNHNFTMHSSAFNSANIQADYWSLVTVYAYIKILKM